MIHLVYCLVLPSIICMNVLYNFLYTAKKSAFYSRLTRVFSVTLLYDNIFHISDQIKFSSVPLLIGHRHLCITGHTKINKKTRGCNLLPHPGSRGCSKKSQTGSSSWRSIFQVAIIYFFFSTIIWISQEFLKLNQSKVILIYQESFNRHSKVL